MMKILAARGVLITFGLALIPLSTVSADEGMWQPHQLPSLAPTLQKMGLEMNPEAIASLDRFPMNAIVSLGGCSASFVSPKGLMATNHHCVYGSVQYNSTPENNLLSLGFLAGSQEEELPAAPGTRVYVTEAVTNVTAQVLDGLSEDSSGLERYQHIENKTKALIAKCESSRIHRCSVPAFHYGLEYFLIKQLEIRDVRLVYAPATSVGKYGGDIDNWQWPRHTGDFGFYRAYVGPDGKPADFNKDNKAYVPEAHLKVSREGVSENDFVMAIGYPGSTDRYRTAMEVDNEFNWYYPQARQMREDLMEVIKNNSAPESQARINYESTLASLANYAKNFKSMVESFQNSDLLERRKATEQELSQWLAADEKRKQSYGEAVAELNALVAERIADRERDLVLSYFSYATMPSTAARLYRLALEKEKPDAEREPGYQERDMVQFEQSLRRISRRYDDEVDKAILVYLLTRYVELPKEQRLPSIDSFFKLNDRSDVKSISRVVEQLYKRTALSSEENRLEWFGKSVEGFRRSKDPMIRYAVTTMDERLALEKESEALIGRFQQHRPQYMAALIAFNRSRGEPIYADANSTLRVTYGQVKGNSPRDGLRNLPFTTLEGILEKDTGQEPFDAPARQLQLIREKRYGDYMLESLGSVPVNFLSTVDITGGNSGSAILNGKGELVGLLFDGVYESIIGDWDFDEEKNRAIAVDSRYMLWVMDYLDGAQELLKELEIVP